MTTIKFERNATKHGPSSIKVTIPPEICKALGIVDKTPLTIYKEEEKIIIEKKEE